jgi:hypothetical protein
MKKKFALISLLTLLAVLALPGAALAAPASGVQLDEVIFGHDYVVASGQTVNGSLLVFGGSVTVETGGRLNGELVVFGGDVSMSGDVTGSSILFGGSFSLVAGAEAAREVVVFGGDADVAGTLGDDLIVIGGDANLQSTAVVNGDLVTPAGEVTRAVGAVVIGNLVDNFEIRDRAIQITPVAPVAPNLPFTRGFDQGWNYGWGFGGDFAWLLFRSFAMATVALLLVLFMQAHMRRVADALVEQPPLAAGYGLLGVIVAAAATVGLSITLVLIPVAVLVPFVAVTAWAFGWISLGLEVGRRLSVAFKATWSPALEATLGTFALTFATGAVSWIPCLGWLLGVALGLAGFGAVILTRFGSQAYVPAAPAPALPAPRKRAVRKTRK